MTFRTMAMVAAASIVPALIALDTHPTTFFPDETFSGSRLTGWHPLGEAKWSASNGEIVADTSAGGGWLMMDKSYQDVSFFASFRCGGDCQTGVLFRAEKTPQGFKGVYVSLAENDQAVYRVTLDPQGKELSREPLAQAGGRGAAPPAQAAGGRGRGGGGGGGGGGLGAAPPGVILPISRPQGGYRKADWNQIEMTLGMNSREQRFGSSAVASNAAQLSTILNGAGGRGSALGGAVADEFGNYGPIGLYAGGSGEVRFKDISYKDLNARVLPEETVSSRFRMQRIDDFYYSWGAAAADFNHDGFLDIVAGPYYYLGPNYTTRREIYRAETVNPSNQYPIQSMQGFAADFTGDGWPDVLQMQGVGDPVILYVNPKGENRRWDKYEVVPIAQKEVALVADIDGDGKPEFIYGGGGYLSYAKPDPANPTAPWVIHKVSTQGPWGGGGNHGLGVGDINGDGRMDIVECYGWFEQPPAGSKQETWTYHPEPFGRSTASAAPGGAEMGVYDVNGDGLLDVVTVMQAHGWGISWFEQKRDSAGKISFVEHPIVGDPNSNNPPGTTVSELHGTAIADIDGDGIPDFVVGKRQWSHLQTNNDPDPNGAPTLLWFKTVRDPKAPGGARFVPEVIHNRSGAGNSILAVDLNHDGAMDLVTTAVHGTFIFWGKPSITKK